MPLSKKRDKERKRLAKARLELCLFQPKLEAWEVTDWKAYNGEIVPIPNCPDGRYRE